MAVPTFTDQLKKALAEYVAKHTPGGQDHEQKRHGVWAGGGAGEEPSGPSSTAPEGAGSRVSSKNARGEWSTENWEVLSPGGQAEFRDELEVGRDAAFDSPGKISDRLEDAGYQSASQPEPSVPQAAPNDPLGFSGGNDNVPLSSVQSPPGEPLAAIQEAQNEGYKKYGQRIEHVLQVAGEDQMSVSAGVDKDGKRIPGRRGVDTMGQYGVWEGDEWKGYPPDRVQLHTDMVRAELDRQREKNDGRSPKNDRQVIIMAGLPGSGKTFTLESQLGEYFDMRDYMTVNADKLKEHIVSMDDPTDPTGGDLTPGEMSSLVHEESSYLSKVMYRAAREQGTNVALDITAANQEKTLKLIDEFKAAGYTVNVVHVDVDTEEAVASALLRAGEGSPVEGKLGRLVPPEFIRKQQLSDGSGKDVIDAAFSAYTQAANGSVFAFRNWPLTGRKEEKPPQLLWSRTPQRPLLGPESGVPGPAGEPPTEPFDVGRLDEQIWEQSRIAASILAAIGARR